MDSVAGLPGVPYSAAQLITKRAQYKTPNVPAAPTPATPGVNTSIPPTQQRATVPGSRARTQFARD